MATSVQERCAVIFGDKENSDYFMSIAKSGENDDGETTYHYGAFFGLPTSIKSLPDGDVKKYATIGAHRVTSVSQAPFRGLIEKGELTKADVEKWFADYNGNNLDVRLNEVRERKTKEPADTSISVAIAKLAVVLKGKTDEQLTGASVPIDVSTYPLDKKGNRNHRAMAKLLQEQGHPWYAQAYKLATATKGFE